MHKNNGRAFSVPTVFKNNGGIFPISSYEKTEYEMMKHLVEKTKAAGHQLTFKEASVDPDMIQPNEFPRCTRYHSFGEAAETAWEEINPKPTKKSCLTEQGKKLVEHLRKHPTAPIKPTKKESDSVPVQKSIKIGPIPRFD